MLFKTNFYHAYGCGGRGIPYIPGENKVKQRTKLTYVNFNWHIFSELEATKT